MHHHHRRLFQHQYPPLQSHVVDINYHQHGGGYHHLVSSARQIHHHYRLHMFCSTNSSRKQGVTTKILVVAYFSFIHYGGQVLWKTITTIRTETKRGRCRGITRGSHKLLVINSCRRCVVVMDVVVVVIREEGVAWRGGDEEDGWELVDELCSSPRSLLMWCAGCEGRGGGEKRGECFISFILTLNPTPYTVCLCVCVHLSPSCFHCCRLYIQHFPHPQP
ncbi:hypothetical protein QVD17_20848 [Tagetes erecta]|uniref:Uncharacterized protein n=1 Tax=Tagetes erecta TaxID=13708 RepID=A0AAD8KQL0_TARER|nr:hypothetical protein QVD17_20848 [Tagetes erecta]